jgi:hypothetical protein
MRESVSATIVVTLAIALFLCVAVFSHHALHILSSSDAKTAAPVIQAK